MGNPLNVLIIEDREHDATLMVRELQRAGYDIAHERVETEEGMRAAIKRQSWDAILSDFSMPQFSASGALAVAVEAGLDIPFIIVSGALGEERAVEAMRSGVHDFVPKDNLKKLEPVIARELDAARIRRETSVVNKKLDFERKLLEQLMDGTPDAISIKDLQRRYIRLNDAELRTLNVKLSQEACGQTADTFIPPERAQLQRNDEERVLSTGEPVFNSIEKIVNDDGTVRWLSATRAPMRGLNGEIAGIVAIARDITDSKRQEQMKNEFIATVNHELRTPLTSILGALILMENCTPGTTQDIPKQLIGIALQNGRRLASIVNDILDIERIESGAMIYDMRDVDVCALIEKTIEANQVYAEKYQVRLRFDATAKPCVITTDPDRLTQIITNLLSNAVKFSPSGGEVAINIDETDQTVRITVRDQGPGIGREYADRIFEKFVQVDASDARAKGGTGLGLPISKQIANNLGGDIYLESVPNVGSSFHVVLNRH